MRVLVACEYSGVVTRAFRSMGHDAFSCDLLPTNGDAAHHIQGDVVAVLSDGWDLMIAHPPCTHLAVSGARWFASKPPSRSLGLCSHAHGCPDIKNRHRKPSQRNLIQDQEAGSDHPAMAIRAW